MGGDYRGADNTYLNYRIRHVYYFSPKYMDELEEEDDDEEDEPEDAENIVNQIMFEAYKTGEINIQ